MEQTDILIIGAGAAGIAAAKSAWDAGCSSITMVDRKSAMGGVLLQCTHHGFGPMLSGPEYTHHLLNDFPSGIRFIPNTTVLSVSPDRTAQLSGGMSISFRQLILASGCLEIPMGALPIAGTRPRGVYTAGQMQEMMNLHGYIPQGPALILGSGDLGLIMARQMAALGIDVTLVERRPICGGMARNQKCLNEYPIRLLCGTTVTEVLGKKSLESVRLSDGSSVPCKTLLIAAGLRPDRELIHDLDSPDWLHLCGNCSTVHPMVESVIHEGKQAGLAAWQSIRGSI